MSRFDIQGCSVDSGDKRKYRMRKRADKVAETRQRIVEGAIRLHTSIGPARTTISAVADAAQVTRATVYSHFPDEEALFAACTGQWMALHPPPDPNEWLAVAALDDRVTRALDELYAWFEANADAWRLYDRDLDAMPAAVAHANEAFAASMVNALISGSRTRGRARRRLAAVAAHVTTFATWDSLATRGGLTHQEAVTVAVRFLLAAAS